MRRPGRILAVLLTLAAFLAVSLALARVLSANGGERTAIADLLDAQARGDTGAMLARIDGCRADPLCRSTVAANARRLRSHGKLEVVRLDPSTSFSIGGGTTGTARVVWHTPGRTTVVQCVRVRRGGDLVGGLSVELLALSRPIARESSCPVRPAKPYGD
jgi:hypothetical protein